MTGAILCWSYSNSKNYYFFLKDHSHIFSRETQSFHIFMFYLWWSYTHIKKAWKKTERERKKKWVWEVGRKARFQLNGILYSSECLKQPDLQTKLFFIFWRPVLYLHSVKLQHYLILIMKIHFYVYVFASRIHEEC